MDQRPAPRRRLIVPLVLAVSVAGTIAAAVSTSGGCKSDKPHVDAGIGDGQVDTPLV